jgi:choline dehydrogenase-like flavoprotein
MANVSRRRVIKAIGGAGLTTGLTLTVAAAREHTTTTAAATPSSVVNQHLQCWDVPNVFSFGAAAFPQNITYNHTLTIGAVTY